MVPLGQQMPTVTIVEQVHGLLLCCMSIIMSNSHNVVTFGDIQNNRKVNIKMSLVLIGVILYDDLIWLLKPSFL